MQFRKSFSLGKGVRLNLGKRGIGVSAGVPGFRTGVGTRGAYTTTSIPGTGLSNTKYSRSQNKSESEDSGGILTCLMLVVLGVVLVLLFKFPIPVGIFLIIGIAGYIFWQRTPKQQAVSRLLKAIKLKDGGQYKDAILLLSEAMVMSPGDIRIENLIGEALYLDGQYSNALPYLQNIVNSDNSDFANSYSLAYTFAQLKDYDNAIPILQRLLEMDEQNLTVIKLLGLCFTAKQQFDIAIEVYKKAPLLKRNLDDDLLSIHYQLAITSEQAGDKKSALKHFKRVYAHDSNYKDIAKKLSGDAI